MRLTFSRSKTAPGCVARALLALIASWLLISSLEAATGFTPTRAIPVRIISNAPAYSGSSFVVARLIDGNRETEYASENHGTNTFVEFAFDRPSPVTVFRHVDRNDPALVGASELVFSDAAGRVVNRVAITHPDRKAGETFFILPAPVLASRVKWQVTRLGRTGIGTVGGAEITFFATDPPEAVPRHATIQARSLPLLERNGNQPVRLTVDYPYLEPTDVLLRVVGGEPRTVRLRHGPNPIACDVPAVKANTARIAELELAPGNVKSVEFQQTPVRPLTIYILPHSHTDIGYTELQTTVEKKQVDNLLRGIQLARQTAGYPEGARFVWNVEVLWAAELYLRQCDERQRGDFLKAVKAGQVELNGMYLNELTALCRPEELIQLFRYATQLSQQTGKPIESVMISDVPGYTWGTVTAMAQAGIRYLSAGPNYGERAFMKVWENKPFYWIGPDGKSKVLVWIPFQGYALSHRYGEMSARLLDDLCTKLQASSDAYEIAYIRWAGQGDNGVPDASLCDFVEEWNATHESPRLVIAGTTEAFQAFEKRYGDTLPVFRGDWTPYWEDGAASTAQETALNRQSSDRVAQAQTLFAMFNPAVYPKEAFAEAWRNVLLFSEHTWGAQGSITDPEHPQTTEQWAIKKSYADQADRQSRQLLAKALASRTPVDARPETNWIEVINTLSWERTELVVVSAELSIAGDRVSDETGRTTPSQRLKTGELAFLARAVPPFATARYRIKAGAADRTRSEVRVVGSVLENSLVRVQVDETSGGFVELKAKGIQENFAGKGSSERLNEFFYVRGNEPDNLQTNGPVQISIGENGPLVASLIIESDAPSCHGLRRELRMIAGQDHVEIINRVDKARLEVKSYREREGKESMGFAFPFNVPDGEVLMDIPLAVMRPERDQLPASCKNWLTVGRWVDIKNENSGVTWVTLDAPLIQFYDTIPEQRQWRPQPTKSLKGARKFFSWVMNNRWGTNYKAYQEGPTVFRYVLRPHRKSSPAEATRFATRFSQPLIVAPDRGAQPAQAIPLFKLDSPDVIVTGLKPSDDGKAWIIRLFGASGQEKNVALQWGAREPARVALSDTSEIPLAAVTGNITVPGFGLVTLRADFE